MLAIFTGEQRSESIQVIESMHRTLAKNRRLIRHLARNSRHGYADRGRGVLEGVVRVDFDGKAYHNVISRTVRGLYWTETGSILAREATIYVRPFRQLSSSSARSVRDLMNMVPAKALNASTFQYKMAPADHGESIWVMQFFGAHQAFALVRQQDAQQVLQADRPVFAGPAA